MNTIATTHEIYSNMGNIYQVHRENQSNTHKQLEAIDEKRSNAIQYSVDQAIMQMWKGSYIKGQVLDRIA
ncbi:MAG: hypothetical protein OEX00_02760 [Gammaproteobacteria bacterium]|nr:hypothetical protein [Gammaproteobacteria bacterium]MDH5693005.1 hypothetical protein [Gammaproteobacteria bacterium]